MDVGKGLSPQILNLILDWNLSTLSSLNQQMATEYHLDCLLYFSLHLILTSHRLSLSENNPHTC